LKKYPEIAFDASKVDTFGNSNAYTQAGYEISSSSRYSPSYDVLSAFNGTYLIDHFASKNLSFSTSSPYNYTLFTNNVTDKDSTQYTGEEIKVKTTQ
jgi:DNA polymerase III sliding clamp (beta) subunit (PCNA family)